MSTHRRIALLAAFVLAAATCARAQLASATGSPTPDTSKASAPAATPAASKTSKAKPADKPAESKPAESKPTDSRPGAKTNGAKAAAKGIPALPPEKAQAVSIPRFEKPPVIDGVLDEEVWKTAAVLKDFYQINPGDNTAPTKPTEVMVAYDAKTLYFAFHCYDDPDKVRATVAKRDSV
ncbi:MAG TPA: hypothetical protein VE713_17730, partial [Pyrinomonadaceae bacterium]|nr:hypothetical protein [Pyrinomonadaceae bacterium]